MSVDRTDTTSVNMATAAVRGVLLSLQFDANRVSQDYVAEFYARRAIRTTSTNDLAKHTLLDFSKVLTHR